GELEHPDAKNIAIHGGHSVLAPIFREFGHGGVYLDHRLGHAQHDPLGKVVNLAPLGIEVWPKMGQPGLGSESVIPSQLVANLERVFTSCAARPPATHTLY